ncbi:MAG: hypothetical protein DMG36_19600 [Acidobacteria bacterium]|nr:MAG: hypothetical protein DMG36_19600 [Acidobacteriota bacterium]
MFSGPVARYICICGVAVCALLLSRSALSQMKRGRAAALSDFRPREEVPGESFIGAVACASCHAQKSGSHLQTAMGHALQKPTESAVLQSHPRMTFQARQFSYEIVTDNQQSVYRVTDGKETFSEPILYAFGNAHVAQTYVFRHGGKLYEGRVSYYSAIDGLDWTIGDVLNPPPNLEQAAGRDIDGDEARNCFSCHGTAALINGKLRLDRMFLGVTCEACHGPGEKHAIAKLLETGEGSAIFNPKKLAPETLSQEFCGACHRGVDAVAMMPDLGGISNVRFQPYRLFNSRGHDPKEPHLACTACHDPHQDLKQNEAGNDSNCTVCHEARGPAQNGAAGKRCPVRSDKCVTCHMPKVELPGAHFKFTDHRIRIVRPREPYPY